MGGWGAGGGALGILLNILNVKRGVTGRLLAHSAVIIGNKLW